MGNSNKKLYRIVFFWATAIKNCTGWFFLGNRMEKLHNRKKMVQKIKAIPLQKLKGLGNFLVAPRGYHTKGQAVLLKGGAD